MILDNADDPSYDYQEFLPPGHRGIVLLTSRNSECAQYATTHHEALEGLDDEDGVQLLFRTARIPPQQRPSQKDHALAICNLLGSHPLALIQAGSYVAKQHCTLADYPRAYQRHRQRLLQFHPAQARSRYRGVYATFEASMDIIKALHPEGDHAVQLLSILSALHWSPLPLSIFGTCWRAAKSALRQRIDYGGIHEGLCAWHVEPLSCLLQPHEPEWDPFRLTNALQLLQNLALVSLQTSNDVATVSMHPLAHAWSRDRLSSSEQSQSWTSAICLVAFVHPSEFDLTSEFELLRPHFSSLYGRDVREMLHAGATNMLIEALLACGWSSYAMGLNKESSSLLADIFKELDLDPLCFQKDWVRLYDLYANNLIAMRATPDLVILMAQIWEAQEQRLPVRHAERFRYQRSLALAYTAMGDFQTSIDVLTRAIEMRKEHQLHSNPRFFDERWLLVESYVSTGQGAKAVEIAEAAYARDNPSTLPRSDLVRRDKEQVLARAYLSNGQWQKAIELLEDLRAVTSQILPKLHSERLRTLSLLGRAYRLNGQTSDAIAITEDVAQSLDQIVAFNHLDRLANLRNLAQALCDDNQTDRAIEIFKEVIEAENTFMPKEHAQRWWTNVQLASFYLKLDKAQQSIDILEKIIGPSADNPNQKRNAHARVLSLLTEAYSRNGQEAQAADILEKSRLFESQVEGSAKRPESEAQ